MVFAAGYTSPLHGHGGKPCLIEKGLWSSGIFEPHSASESTAFELTGWVRFMLAGTVRYRCTFRPALVNKGGHDSASGMGGLGWSNHHCHFGASRSTYRVTKA